MEVPEAKSSILQQFHSVVAAEMSGRQAGNTFKKKEDFDAFMNICLRKYKESLATESDDLSISDHIAMV